MPPSVAGRVHLLKTRAVRQEIATYHLLVERSTQAIRDLGSRSRLGILLIRSRQRYKLFRMPARLDAHGIYVVHDVAGTRRRLSARYGRFAPPFVNDVEEIEVVAILCLDLYY